MGHELLMDKLSMKKNFIMKNHLRGQWMLVHVSMTKLEASILIGRKGIIKVKVISDPKCPIRI